MMGGLVDTGQINFTDRSMLTIDAGGAVSVTGSYHAIAANTGTSDNLDEINGGTQGQMLAIMADTGDTITVRHNQSNIKIKSASNITLAGNDHLLLLYDGGFWNDVGQGIEGALLADGSVPLTADWDAGAFDIELSSVRARSGANLILEDNGAVGGIEIQNTTGLILAQKSLIMTPGDYIETNILRARNTNELDIRDSGNATVWKNTTDGHITKPKNCAFYAYLSADADNVTGAGGADYKLLLNSELFDRNSDWDAATNYRFNAPVTGIYHFDACVTVHDVTASHNYIYMSLVTSSATGTYYSTTPHAGNMRDSTNQFRLLSSWTISLTLADTVELKVNVGGGTAVIDVTGGAVQTWLAGYLVG